MLLYIILCFCNTVMFYGHANKAQVLLLLLLLMHSWGVVQATHVYCQLLKWYYDKKSLLLFLWMLKRPLLNMLPGRICWPLVLRRGTFISLQFPYLMVRHYYTKNDKSLKMQYVMQSTSLRLWKSESSNLPCCVLHKPLSHTLKLEEKIKGIFLIVVPF